MSYNRVTYQCLGFIWVGWHSYSALVNGITDTHKTIRAMRQCHGNVNRGLKRDSMYETNKISYL